MAVSNGQSDTARRFARALALVLLGSSVAANALSHGLAAYGMRPAWWVVVVVSGVAPAVLGAVVHLAVLCGRAEASQLRHPDLESLGEASPIEEDAGPPADTSDSSPAVGLHSVPSPTPPGDVGDDPGDRVAELLAAGVGWKTLHKETGLTEHYAKKAVREYREASG